MRKTKDMICKDCGRVKFDDNHDCSYEDSNIKEA